MQKIHRAKSLS